MQIRDPTAQLQGGSASPARPPLFVAQQPTNSDGKSTRTISRVFIANRGEIACRVIATCRKLNITSIVIFVDEDATSRHISDADEAINLGSINQSGGNPFLNAAQLVEVAKSANADAIHPGYGYLSENGGFADAVSQAGMIFIGPSSNAMSILGDKRNSKDYLREHLSNAPLIPGFSGSSQDVKDLEAAAEEIGFPVMLKASAGGGGRGMRIVRERSTLKGELERARSEAERSFGSSDCILEKYIESAKHIEVQILGDSYGKVWSLWERECSVQRRHQKVIEETPSPFLSQDRREAICKAAVQIGELIGYEGAGTVEFVVDAKTGSFYFLEVNTRLQVEHPITEEVTGLDIVSLQLYVAAGGSLAELLPSAQIPQQGHAIECRLCAEDPGNDFMPEQGVIRLWKPAEYAAGSRDIRYETGVYSGSRVSIYFDSMIAKIIVWAPTRAIAVQKMAKLLSDTVCVGVRTNQQFLRTCLLHESFQDPAYTTSLIPQNLKALLQRPTTSYVAQTPSDLSIVPGAFLRFLQTQSATKPFQNVRRGFRNQTYDSTNVNATILLPKDPSSTCTPMLLVPSTSGKDVSEDKLSLSLISLTELEKSPKSDDEDTTAAFLLSNQYNVVSRKLRSDNLSNAAKYTVSFGKLDDISSSQDGRDSWNAFDVEILLNSSRLRITIATDANPKKPDSAASYNTVMVHFPDLGTWIEYRCYSLLAYFESLRETVKVATGAAEKSVKAPMPCKVLSVLKSNGDEVKEGEVVMVIESMKMETNVMVAAAGKFMTSCKQGDAVDDGKLLCWVE